MRITYSWLTATLLLFGCGVLLAADAPRKLVGDFNGDGKLTNADIDLLGLEVASSGEDRAFDLSGDGLIDGADVVNFLVLANKLNGDADFDGHVQFPDFVILADHFGQPARQRLKWSQGDFDTDGTVQFPDFAILAHNFGASSVVLGSVAVPEPQGWLLAVLGMAPVLHHRVTRRGGGTGLRWKMQRVGSLFQFWRTTPTISEAFHRQN